MISVTQRIPTEAYAYVEFVGEYEDLKAAFKEHRMLIRRSGEGMPTSEWKAVRHQMYMHGTFDPNLWVKLNADQQFFINEMKKIQREMTRTELSE